MDWLAFSWRFADIDSSINQANSVSWVGFLQGLMGTSNTSALISGWILAGLTAIGVSFVWIAGPRGDLSVRFAVSTFGLILIQPHAMYYDMALILFAYTVCFCRDDSKYGLLCVAWLLGLTQPVASYLGFSPLFLVLISSGAIVTATVLRTAPGQKPSPCRLHELSTMRHDV